MALERQTAPTLQGIEKFHKERYHIASKYVKDKTVLDAACGCGYGTSILANAGAKVILGVDHSDVAVQYARENWKQGNPNVHFQTHDLNTGWLVKNFRKFEYDVVVSLETLEHLKSKISTNLRRISTILKLNGILFFSHPTHEKNRGNKYHHWFDINPSDVITAAECMGFEIIESHQQKANHDRYTYHLVAARKVV